MATGGRPNQTSRTRKDLLQAGSRLMKQGRTFTLEEVAEEARILSSDGLPLLLQVLIALLVESPIDGAVPNPNDLLRGVSLDDPRRAPSPCRNGAPRHDFGERTLGFN